MSTGPEIYLESYPAGGDLPHEYRADFTIATTIAGDVLIPDVNVGPGLPQSIAGEQMAARLGFTAKEIADGSPKTFEVTLHFWKAEKENPDELKAAGDYPHTFGTFEVVIYPRDDVDTNFLRIGWDDFGLCLESKAEYVDPQMQRGIWHLEPHTGFHHLYH